jgi:amidohydrolase
VQLSGPGGHTARPHLTADLVFALGKVITELPAALSRRIDARSGLSLVWGKVNAGSAPNAIPDSGVVEGTVRCLDDSSWHAAPEMMKDLVESIASAYGVTADLTYERSVPPVVNEAVSTQMIAAAADQILGPDAISTAPQSLGGEDFAWYLESIPGSLLRLGTRAPGSVEEFDIHQPMFDVDEECIAVGVKVMTATALTAIGTRQADATLAEADATQRVRPVRPSVGGVTLAGPLLASYSSVA